MKWQCVKCREKVDDDFLVCWACGTARPKEEDPIRKADDIPAEAITCTPPRPRIASSDATKGNPIRCLRCDRQLEYVGTKKFHEGTNAWSLLLGELFINRVHLDVFLCPRCGRVEFFVDGVGEEHRPH